MSDLCVVCSDPLPPLGVWSMPACEACTEAAARETAGLCPRPCNGRPDNFTTAECVAVGECGALAAPIAGPINAS